MVLMYLIKTARLNVSDLLPQNFYIELEIPTLVVNILVESFLSRRYLELQKQT